MVEEGVAYIKLTKEVLEEFDVLPSEASGVVGALGNIDGLKAWVLFFRGRRRNSCSSSFKRTSYKQISNAI